MRELAGMLKSRPSTSKQAVQRPPYQEAMDDYEEARSAMTQALGVYSKRMERLKATRDRLTGEFGVVMDGHIFATWPCCKDRETYNFATGQWEHTEQRCEVELATGRHFETTQAVIVEISAEEQQRAEAAAIAQGKRVVAPAAEAAAVPTAEAAEESALAPIIDDPTGTVVVTVTEAAVQQVVAAVIDSVVDKVNMAYDDLHRPKTLAIEGAPDTSDGQ